MRLFASTQTSNGADDCGDLNVHGVSRWGQAALACRSSDIVLKANKVYLDSSNPFVKCVPR